MEYFESLQKSILLNFTNIIPLNTRSYSIPSQYESRLHVRETAFPPPPHSLQMDKRRQLGKFRWARIPLRARAAANVKQRSRYACAVAEK